MIERLNRTDVGLTVVQANDHGIPFQNATLRRLDFAEVCVELLKRQCLDVQLNNVPESRGVGSIDFARDSHVTIRPTVGCVGLIKFDGATRSKNLYFLVG